MFRMVPDIQAPTMTVIRYGSMFLLQTLRCRNAFLVMFSETLVCGGGISGLSDTNIVELFPKNSKSNYLFPMHSMKQARSHKTVIPAVRRLRQVD
jgi:hypothetical protein